MSDFFRWFWAIIRLHAHCLWRFRFVRGCRMECVKFWMPIPHNQHECVARRDSCSCGKVFYRSRAYDFCFDAWKKETR